MRERERVRKKLWHSPYVHVLVFSSSHYYLTLTLSFGTKIAQSTKSNKWEKNFGSNEPKKFFFFGFLESFYLPKVVLIHFHQIHKNSLFPDTCEKFTSLVLHNFTFVSSFEIEIEWNIVIVRAKTFHKTCADKKLQVNLHIYAYEPIFQPSCMKFFDY